LIDTGTKIHRIQVKTCASPDGPNRKRHGFSLKHGRHEKAYAAGAVDFFALVCLNIDVIYVVPAVVVSGQRTAKTWPLNANSNAKLEKFREGWGQF